MANRGSPLPWSMREKIGELRRTINSQTGRVLSIRAIAEALDLSKTTVQRYAAKFGTQQLPGHSGLTYSST